MNNETLLPPRLEEEGAIRTLRRERLTPQGDLLQLLQEAAMAEDGDEPVVWTRTEKMRQKSEKK